MKDQSNIQASMYAGFVVGICALVAIILEFVIFA